MVSAVTRDKDGQLVLQKKDDAGKVTTIKITPQQSQAWEQTLGIYAQQMKYGSVNDMLADGEGILFDAMSADKLHPTIKAYQVWADALRPIFTEVLGPPAATDLAPPPTGDPSAPRRPR